MDAIAPRPPMRLLKVRDVIDRTQLSRSKVYGLIATGSIPSVSIGRSVRVQEGELEDWIRRQAASGPRMAG